MFVLYKMEAQIDLLKDESLQRLSSKMMEA